MTNEDKADNAPPSKYVRTVDLRPPTGEMMKPGEMIDISGIEELTLRDRTIYNQLIENAFGPKMAERDHQWTIAISMLRGTHKGNERVSDTIECHFSRG